MSRKLLLADDSVTIQRVIELTFADEDVEVLAVGDGRQAIERVKNDNPDIVLADVGMPERDGYEVAAFIKNDPRLAHIPVLLLTGAFEPIDEARAKSVGCDGVLVKPFEPQMVISRVRELLAGSAGTAAPAAAAAVATPPPSAPADVNEGPKALDEYFDRLDAAFAKLGATTTPAVTPAPVVEISASKGPAGTATGAPEPAPTRSPAPPAATVQTSVPTLSEAFAALLTAEQGRPVAPRPERSPALPDDEIDEIVRRVIARMGDADMRRAVLDTAERLVREEIDRIKQGRRS